MHSHTTLWFLLALGRHGLCSPTPQEDVYVVTDIIDPDPEQSVEFGFSTVSYKCTPEPQPAAARVNYDECQYSINTFDRQYPVTSSDNKYTLTHRPEPPTLPIGKTLYCPHTTNPAPRPRGCNFVVDYKYFPYDQDHEDTLTDVKLLGESLIRKCKRKDLFYGGEITGSYGHWLYHLTLASNANTGLPETY